jgi:hypothetical protein
MATKNAETISITDATTTKTLENSYYDNCKVKIESNTLKP